MADGTRVAQPITPIDQSNNQIAGFALVEFYLVEFYYFLSRILLLTDSIQWLSQSDYSICIDKLVEFF